MCIRDRVRNGEARRARQGSENRKLPLRENDRGEAVLRSDMPHRARGRVGSPPHMKDSPWSCRINGAFPQSASRRVDHDASRRRSLEARWIGIDFAGRPRRSAFSAVEWNEAPLHGQKHVVTSALPKRFTLMTPFRKTAQIPLCRDRRKDAQPLLFGQRGSARPAPAGSGVGSLLATGRWPRTSTARAPACLSHQHKLSNAAHPLALVAEEIELAAIGSSGEIGRVERHAGAMQEDLAANPAKAVAQRAVDLDRISPGLRVVIPHMPPARCRETGSQCTRIWAVRDSHAVAARRGNRAGSSAARSAETA